MNKKNQFIRHNAKNIIFKMITKHKIYFSSEESLKKLKKKNQINKRKLNQRDAHKSFDHRFAMEHDGI